MYCMPLKTQVNGLHLFDLTKSALEAGEELAHGIINMAQKSVDALTTCTESLAFNVAEKAFLFAKNDEELNLARYAIDVVTEGAVKLGFDIGEWAVVPCWQTHQAYKDRVFLVRCKPHCRRSALDHEFKELVLGGRVESHSPWQP